MHAASFFFWFKFFYISYIFSPPSFPHLLNILIAA